MPVNPRLILILLVGLMAGAAQAADPPGRSAACLSKSEQRAVVANRQAVPLAAAVKSAREYYRRSELLRARLCRRGDGLVYELTLLSHNGKVRHATVDAENGQLKGR
jgi:uncharacterized membrane protein YkoI